HGDDFVRADGDADLFERAQRPVALADAFGFEQRRHATFPARVRRRLPASPASPAGKAMTITARTAPRKKRQDWVSECSGACSKVKANAPMIGPKKLEKPPSTVMNTSWPDCVQYTSSGSASPTRKPRIAPPAAPYAAEMTNAARRKRCT